jgi:3-phenylpropionate/trans-cinnamate dioxygenase ferredoxin component
MPEVRICGTAEVAMDAARRFDAEGHRLCVVHVARPNGGEWYAVDDECSHADFSLSEGDVWPDECEIECPKHGSTFSLVSGEPQTLPATKPVAVYPVRVDGDDVVVTLP